MKMKNFLEQSTKEALKRPLKTLIALLVICLIGRAILPSQGNLKKQEIQARTTRLTELAVTSYGTPFVAEKPVPQMRTEDREINPFMGFLQALQFITGPGLYVLVILTCAFMGARVKGVVLQICRVVWRCCVFKIFLFLVTPREDYVGMIAYVVTDSSLTWLLNWGLDWLESRSSVRCSGLWGGIVARLFTSKVQFVNWGRGAIRMMMLLGTFLAVVKLGGFFPLVVAAAALSGPVVLGLSIKRSYRVLIVVSLLVGTILVAFATR